ncbi:polysaccharide pyruvyl transferase family protein [Sphingosinicella sp. BN140058]|uniref:polysaccharide pyruvyl transferase family protein n=1 Tax=Sphingosinicella sp. BN140058 TaxID=1892855 RepID=UPI0013EB5FD9|nr:polysaccharide pyruvyl transferase family protein [Sphingosinicella sp. BN140058]
MPIVNVDVEKAAHGRQIGIVGTFDVENYGDLLFPLIAEKALHQRDESLNLIPFSLNSRSAADWPYDVQPIARLPERIPDLRALLIGGGQLVRFDDAYPVPVPPGSRVPLDYWLLPALAGAIGGKPVFWNGIGAWTDSPRAAGLDHIVQEAFAASRLVGLRDEASLRHLARIAPDAATRFVPDTAFGLSRLWPLGEESTDYRAWRQALGLAGRYAVVQANAAMPLHAEAIQRQLRLMDIPAAVILPVCWCHGDRADHAPRLETRILRSYAWLHPHLIREIIARSEILFGSSLHASITAISYGVPLVRGVQYSERKFEQLRLFEGVADIEEPAAMQRLAHGRRGVEALAQDYADRLDRYWDEVAAAALGDSKERDEAARLRTLALFAQLCADRQRGTAASRLQTRATEPIMFLKRRRAHWRNNLLLLNDRLKQTVGGAFGRGTRDPAKEGGAAEWSPSTARDGGGAILDIAAIETAAIATQPYRWAHIENLFAPEDARTLAEAFPSDSFRRVAGNDGEKSYQYLSRSLVHMGASEITRPERLHPAWRALLGDLLSRRYREALSEATGLDLGKAPMEINAIHFGAGAWLGPHVDLKDKIATHILYFNEDWDSADGGCLQVLRSRDDADREAEILPIVGGSALLVRSDDSWHSVSPVARGCRTSRKNINVIFHLPGSISTMWPPGEKHRLIDYAGS